MLHWEEESVADATLKEESVADATLKEESVANATLKEESVADATLKEECIADATLGRGVCKCYTGTNLSLTCLYMYIYFNSYTHDLIIST